MKFVATIVCCTLISTAFVQGHKLKDHDSSQSSESCEETSDVMMLQVISKLAYYIPHNMKYNKAAILDHRNNKSALYDGDTGDVFVFSYEEETGIYIPGKLSDKTWNSKKTSFKKYFQNPVSPTELHKIGTQVGYKFDSELITEELKEKIANIFTHLSVDYSSKCAGLGTAFRISKVLSDGYRTSLLNFENVIGDVYAENRGDLKWIFGQTRGLGDFFVPFGSADVLLQKKVRLDYPKILTQESGIHTFCYLLDTLSSHFDLGKILGNLVSSELSFFAVVSKLGGEVDYGFDGLIYILTEIMKYNNKENSKENLAAALKSYITDSRGTSDGLEKKWLSGLQVLLQTIKKNTLEEDFKDLVKILEDMSKGNWKQNGVDMSEILKNLLALELPGKAESADEILKILEKKE